MPTSSGAMRCVARLLSAICLVIATLLTGEHARAEPAPPLTLKVMTVSESSLWANMTLVMGKTEAALIDVPFTRADAHRVVADILESGKTLKYIYITHDHPDHFMSLEVLADAFPDARAISVPAVVADLWRSLPIKMRRWGPMLGANGPRRPVVPVGWDQPTFQVDGQELQIIGPVQGDHVHATAIYVPSIKALIAGDIVFEDVHPWLGEHTPERRKAWVQTLDQLIALKPVIVVPGHQLPGEPQSPAALAFPRDSVVAFDKAAATAKTSPELASMMQTRFPKAHDVLGGFILGNSAKVGVGETPPWEE